MLEQLAWFKKLGVKKTRQNTTTKNAGTQALKWGAIKDDNGA